MSKTGLFNVRKNGPRRGNRKLTAKSARNANLICAKNHQLLPVSSECVFTQDFAYLVGPVSTLYAKYDWLWAKFRFLEELFDLP